MAEEPSFLLNFDALLSASGRTAAYGWVLSTLTGSRLVGIIEKEGGLLPTPIRSVNEIKYQSLIIGLNKALEKGIRSITVESDSECIDNVTGVTFVDSSSKSKHLSLQAIETSKNFDRIDFRLVDSERNMMAYFEADRIITLEESTAETIFNPPAIFPSPSPIQASHAATRPSSFYYGREWWRVVQGLRCGDYDDLACCLQVGKDLNKVIRADRHLPPAFPPGKRPIAKDVDKLKDCIRHMPSVYATEDNDNAHEQCGVDEYGFDDANHLLRARPLADNPPQSQVRYLLAYIELYRIKFLLQNVRTLHEKGKWEEAKKVWNNIRTLQMCLLTYCIDYEGIYNDAKARKLNNANKLRDHHVYTVLEDIVGDMKRVEKSIAEGGKECERQELKSAHSVISSLVEPVAIITEDLKQVSLSDNCATNTISPPAAPATVPSKAVFDLSVLPPIIRTILQKHTCSLCRELMACSVKLSSCSHAFCYPCLLHKSQIQQICPTCQTAYEDIRLSVVPNRLADKSIREVLGKLGNEEVLADWEKRVQDGIDLKKHHDQQTNSKNKN